MDDHDELERLREQVHRLEHGYIEIEKKLCAVLGIEWSPVGMSCETLILAVEKRLNGG